MKTICTIILWTLSSILVYGQHYTGVIRDAATNAPVPYVNVGIVGKNMGTVSDNTGFYSMTIPAAAYNQDTIGFTHIGYAPHYLKVADYTSLASKDIILSQQTIPLGEVIVQPTKMQEKILGNGYKGKSMQAGFEDNSKGFECGVFLKIKKKAVLEELICHIITCTYDSLLYRVNVYREDAEDTFVNVLHEPIYVQQKMQKGQKTLVVDLTPYHIAVEGNTLVTLEHIADMGKGKLTFSACIFGSPCYYRQTSLDTWDKTPRKLSFTVKAKVEK